MKNFLFRYFLLVTLGVATYSNAAGHSGHNNRSFEIVAFGDMPYYPPDDYKKLENLLKFVNSQDQAFNVFVGDIKSSKTICSNDLYYKIYGYFNESRKPLIYTPGDNEWTDCKKPVQAFDPNERLAFLRSVFYKMPCSLGKRAMQLTPESSYPAYSQYVENVRWHYNTITFATVHLVGSNNNYISNASNGNKEYIERCKADSFWLEETFSQAKKDNSSGVVLFTHADMFTADKGTDGFTHIIAQLATLTKNFARPVLLVNGDSHRFLVDKPLFADKNRTKTLMNFTRVQVFGEYDVHAVAIHFDPENPVLFYVKQLIIPGN